MIYLIYRDILIYNGKPTPYTISTEGEIYNSKGKKLKTRINNSGYLIVDIYPERKVKKTVLVHRLVAETFIPNPNNFSTVNHKDGNKLNPHYYNLEWCTYSDNNNHALYNELRVPLKCEDHQLSTLTNSQVHKICKLLELGTPYSDIVDILNLGNIKNIRSKIKMINTKNAWRDISKEYKFPEGKNRKKVYSDELIHEICKLFSNGVNRNQIIIYLNLENSKKVKDLLYSIYTHRKYKYISKHYKW